MVNTVIVGLFVLEIAMKFFAYGCAEFWRGEQSGWSLGVDLDFFCLEFRAWSLGFRVWIFNPRFGV